MKRSIHLSDYHQITIDGLKILLSKFPLLEVTETSNDFEDLMYKFSKNPTDILIIDINMPNINHPIESVQKILMINPKCEILVLSYLNKVQTIKDLFKNGIQGYLDKSQGYQFLEKALQTINAGEPFISEKLRTEIMNSFCGNESLYKNNFKIEKKLEPLTERELDVLKLICSEFNSKEISDQLYISQHTVNTHRKNLLKKLNAKNTVGLVRYALENQLI